MDKISKLLNKITDNKAADVALTIITVCAIPLLLYMFHANFIENILIGFLVVLIARILFIYHKSSEISDNISKLYSIKNDHHITNKELAEIEQKYDLICQDQKYEFFKKWYKNDIDELKTNLNDTLQKEFVNFPASKLLDQHHPIYQVFDDGENNFFYATSTFKGINWYLSPSGRRFVKFIQKNVESNKIKSVKRLFIYDDANGNTELSDPLSQMCFALHKRGVYDFKVITKDEYTRIFKECDKVGNYKTDFGIYGKKFVWETTRDSNKGELTRGEFSMNEKRVNWYMDLFDTLWKEEGQDSPVKIEKSIQDVCLKDSTLADLNKLYKVFMKRQTTPKN